MGIFDEKTETQIRLKRKVSRFAAALTQARVDAGLSQSDAAEALTAAGFKTNRPCVLNWEHDNSTPKLPKFVAYCEILGKTPNELLGYNEND